MARTCFVLRFPYSFGLTGFWQLIGTIISTDGAPKHPTHNWSSWKLPRCVVQCDPILLHALAIFCICDDPMNPSSSWSEASSSVSHWSSWLAYVRVVLHLVKCFVDGTERANSAVPWPPPPSRDALQMDATVLDSEVQEIFMEKRCGRVGGRSELHLCCNRRNSRCRSVLSVARSRSR